MRTIMAGMDKVLIDSRVGGSGVVPYLPLDALTGRGAGTPATGTPATGGK